MRTSFIFHGTYPKKSRGATENDGGNYQWALTCVAWDMDDDSGRLHSVDPRAACGESLPPGLPCSKAAAGDNARRSVGVLTLRILDRQIVRVHAEIPSTCGTCRSSSVVPRQPCSHRVAPLRTRSAIQRSSRHARSRLAPGCFTPILPVTIPQKCLHATTVHVVTFLESSFRSTGGSPQFDPYGQPTKAGTGPEGRSRSALPGGGASSLHPLEAIERVSYVDKSAAMRRRRSLNVIAPCVR
jgi:hypothetical protein